MAGINKVILIGNLGRDPEIRQLESGVKVASFSLATTESYKSKDGNKVDQTEWHNIVLWRGLAEVAEKYLKKGHTIFLEGKIRTRSWDDKDGNKRYTTEIVGDNMTMLTTKRDAENTYQTPPPSTDEPLGHTQEADDLPF
ncbi:MAG: single-stranded DNA-binding protein [Bacteroidales bacterium]|nr:single-stranded DNA-binding protein [Bacteroidales bacterium]